MKSSRSSPDPTKENSENHPPNNTPFTPITQSVLKSRNLNLGKSKLTGNRELGSVFDVEKAMPIIPENDGVDHINIRFDAATKLGRMLDNLAYTPFHHPQIGSFRSIEGFYWYLVSGKEIEALRRLWGPKIREYSTQLSNRPEHINGDYIDCVPGALTSKIIQNTDLFTLFVQSKLPFKCYSVYGKSKIKIIEGKGHQNQTEFLERMRETLNPVF